ncbi:glycoside hydrolase family 13 protein [Lacticaseibacillus paracasei]|uniref:glycoside hydrolase family 13 protein n=1 Tax=Lacticaseibacillus paracasei TaxID=1597 RepID=UPI0021A38782|nr:alpha-glucosidase [Lacticaseibacillus paracasei]MCT3339196.1 alpha-glucosidase [Lacticaseibacillus paracasei]
MNKSWWQEAVVYQVYPRSFQDTNGDGIGDLQGIIKHLDYIKKLGVDVIWLNPIYSSPNDDNGYDISDYRNIMTEFGTMADFNQLLKTIHEHGLKLMMDLVVNHTSDENAWFVEAKRSVNNKYHDFYLWRDGKDGKAPNNWQSEFSGSAWQYVPSVNQYYLHLFTKKQADLNWDNSDVRHEIFDLMNWWCDKGIDGFRMDVINLISKDPAFPDDPNLKGEVHGSSMTMAANGPHVHEYLKEMYKEVLSKHDLITVGETPGASTADAIKYTGFNSHELEMVFQFEHMGVDISPTMGKWTDRPFKLVDLKRIMSRWQTELNGKAWNSLYWNNHDQPRVVSRFGNDAAEYRELSAKMLGNCLHMMQGTPYIYQGEEIGMTNVGFPKISDYHDVETLNAYKELVQDKHSVTDGQMMRYIHKHSRDNARTPMQWNDEPNAGFTAGEPWIDVNPNYDQINVANALADPNSVFYFYQKLNQLRKQYSIIVYGDYELIEPEDEQVYMYWRHLDGQKLLVVSNFTDQTLRRSIIQRRGTGHMLISNYQNDSGDQLRPYESRTYLIN